MKLSTERYNEIKGWISDSVLVALIGQSLTLPNGWGNGVVCGAWKMHGDMRVLLAWPNAENPRNLFNELLSDLVEP